MPTTRRSHLLRARRAGIILEQRRSAGIPPTGEEMDVTAIAIHRIQDAKIVEHWSSVDSAALMAQLGLITLPGPPPS